MNSNFQAQIQISRQNLLTWKIQIWRQKFKIPTKIILTPTFCCTKSQKLTPTKFFKIFIFNTFFFLTNSLSSQICIVPPPRTTQKIFFTSHKNQHQKLIRCTEGIFDKPLHKKSAKQMYPPPKTESSHLNKSCSARGGSVVII